MSISSIKGTTVDVQIWAPLDEVESQALTQLRNIASLPNVFRHVAAMPDVHLGKGATVGSVIAMKGAVSPAAVGVDIGCGMTACRTRLRASDLPDNLEALRAEIESTIPVGPNSHAHELGRSVLGGALVTRRTQLFERYSSLTSEVFDIEGRASKQVGTLGGGNHFIELCLDDGNCEQCRGLGYDEDDHPEGVDNACPACAGEGTRDPAVWLMLHSGSRNIGKTLAEIHMARAKKLTHNQIMVDRDLATFLAGTPEMTAYLHDLYWAQEYAALNRDVMLRLYQRALETVLRDDAYDPPFTYETPIRCHHNYVSEEVHYGENVSVTRKGAISAKRGELGIIPGSMGTKSYIVRGLGNPESFNSASHGAGRRMSRGEAKRTYTMTDFEAQTLGVCCRKDISVLDEIPGAYKDIDAVMENQKDLVEIVATLKQVLCVKG